MHKKVYMKGNGSLILSCDLGIISICYSDNDLKSKKVQFWVPLWFFSKLKIDTILQNTNGFYPKKFTI